MVTSAAELARLAWLADEELAHQGQIVEARAWFAGEHDIPLTDRQRQFLGLKGGEQFAFNFIRIPVVAMLERMEANGFVSTSPAAMRWLWDVWTANRMASQQEEVYRSALVDGEAFVLGEWVEEFGIALTAHPRYTATDVGGNGYGCKAHYSTRYPVRRGLKYISKRWTEEYFAGGRFHSRRRATLYYPDRIEKYVISTTNEAGWEPIRDAPDEPWPIPWVDKGGRPLGIFGGHFHTPGSQSELWPGIGPQKVINKTVMDMLAAGDVAGFRLLVALGFWPTSDGLPPAEDGSNVLTLAPGAVLATDVDGARVQAVEAGDLGALLTMFETAVMALAQVTDTPAYRFQVGKQVARAETLRQQEGPLLAKIEKRQMLFGDVWEDFFEVAARVARHFGGGRGWRDLDGTPRIAPDVPDIETRWSPMDVVTAAQLEAVVMKRQALGISQRQAWREAGYTEDQMETMERELAQEGAEERETEGVKRKTSNVKRET